MLCYVSVERTVTMVTNAQPTPDYGYSRYRL